MKEIKNVNFEERKKSIKFDDKKHLILIPLLVLVVLTLVIPIITGALGEILPNSNPDAMISWHSTILMILNVVLALLVISKIGKIKLVDLGFQLKGAFIKSLIGAITGFLAISLVAMTIKLLGGVTISYNFKTEYIMGLLLGLIMFSFQGTYEEIIYRGYLFPHFSKSMGTIFAILTSSVLFTLLHALNPGMQIMPIINLFLASVVFSLVYFIWGNMWVSGFAHAIWNYSQGCIYGSLVSGIHLNNSIMVSTPKENMTLLSGGNFGFEGSIVTTILGLILIIILVFVMKKKNNCCFYTMLAEIKETA